MDSFDIGSRTASALLPRSTRSFEVSSSLQSVTNSSAIATRDTSQVRRIDPGMSPAARENTRGCSSGVLKDLNKDYELIDCAELMVQPGSAAPPRGTLRGCRNLVFWDTPMGTVAQEHSQNVIFVQKEEGAK